jgi:hypothetical protein
MHKMCEFYVYLNTDCQGVTDNKVKVSLFLIN